MKQSIEALKSNMRASLDFHKGFSELDAYYEEIKAYVDAINILELYMYDQIETKLEDVLN